MKAGTIYKIAQKVEGEGSVFVGKNHDALVAIAQCIKDIYETKLLGDVSIDTVLEKAFNAPACTPSRETTQAVREVFEQGVRRFPDARILQFRSFANYSDGYGNPDTSKLSNLYNNYDYLGSDSISNKWGHFYFGRKEERKMKKVMIDPGHYGSYYNQSPCNQNYYESNFTWDISNKLKKYLQEVGIQADLTRNNKDQDVGLVDRGKMSEGYDLFISMHSNAVGDSSMNKREEVDYPVAYCLVDDQRFDFDETSREIGQRLATGVKEVLNTKQDGIIYLWTADWDRDGDGQLNDNYLGVLHGARLVGTPAVVLEHSFHTNTAMTNKLLQESYIEALAKKDAEVIAEFFGVYKKTKIKMTSFGLCDSTVTVLSDKLPIYRDASMYNQIGTLKKGEKWRAVQSYSLSDNRKGLRLETGYYINAIQGVHVERNKMPKTVKVTNGPDGLLNVRDFPNSNGSSVLYQLHNENLFDVIGQCYNNGDHWYLVHIKNSNVDITGFVAARYTK